MLDSRVLAPGRCHVWHDVPYPLCMHGAKLVVVVILGCSLSRPHGADLVVILGSL